VPLLGELRAFWRTVPRDERAALAVIGVVAIALRLLTLAQPMRHDESITYLEFVSRPLWQALSRYSDPNNHLFHTLLAKGSVALFGDSPWALRLPAFVAGLAIVPAGYAVARMLYGARAALIAAALLASSGVLALYSTNARGYTIVILAFLVLVLIGGRLIRESNARLWAAFALTAALGVWTIPVMLFPLGAVALWLGLSFVVDGRRRELGWLAASLAAGAALTLLAYGPVFSRTGVAALAQNKFAASSVWTQFLADLAITSFAALKSWGLGLPPLVSLPLMALIVLAIVRHGQYSAFRVGLPLAAYVWSAWLLVVTHRAPFPRIWLWFAPIAAALAGVGLVYVLERWKRLAPLAERLPKLAGAIAIAAASSVVYSLAVPYSRDTGTFIDARETAHHLSEVLRQGDRVLAIPPTSGPLAYYFRREGLDTTYLHLDEAQARRLVIVVNEAEGETMSDVVREPAIIDTSRFSITLLAERPSSKVYVLERRNAPK